MCFWSLPVKVGTFILLISLPDFFLELLTYRNTSRIHMELSSKKILLQGYTTEELSLGKEQSTKTYQNDGDSMVIIIRQKQMDVLSILI